MFVLIVEYIFTGQVVWSREEALSSIVNVEMLDLPVSDLEAEIEKEFGTKQGNILDLIILMIHLNQFFHLIANTEDLGVTSEYLKWV